MRANDAELGSTRATFATGSPAGKVPSMPDVTSMSPTWKSALAGTKRSSTAPSCPSPKVTARTPLRTFWIGIDCDLSVSIETSDTNGNTRVTCPSTPR